MMPQMTSEEEGPFVNSRLLEHLQVKTCKQPHYVGSETTIKCNYLQNELQKLGLETSLQEGYTDRLETWLNQKIS
jgi:hypothetical protein